MKKISFLTFLLLISISIWAQKSNYSGQGEKPTGKIFGSIIDQSTNENVLYATVALYSFRDSSIVTGTMSGDGGKFIINDVPAGRYYLIIKFIGYDKYIVNDIKVRPAELSIDLGQIKLKQATNYLQGVEIVADKTFVEYKIDKKVVNVGKDLNASGGTAVDALENVPSVTVDIDGNVALRGSSSFTVFINGKPTPLAGTEALQQIPVGAIKNIEVITNPSAKYDPDGLSGIINVVLNENVKLGLNGLIDVNISNKGSYGLNGVLSYSIGKFNVFAGGNYNNNKMPGIGNSELSSFANDTTDYRLTSIDRERGRGGYNLKGGFDYVPNPKNTFSFEGSFGKRSDDKNFSSLIHEYNLPSSYDIYSMSFNPGSGESDYYSFSANYEYKIDELGSNIQTSGYYENKKDFNTDRSEEYFSDASWNKYDSLLNGIITSETETGPQYRFNIDLVKKLKNNKKFEAGFQTRLNPEFHDYKYEEYIADSGWAERLDYGSQLNFNQSIYSGYALYAGEYKTFGYQIGLRGEHTYRNVYDNSRDYSFKINRFDLFPTLHFSKKFKGNHQMLLSYSRRVDRPDGWELEPFTRYISSNFKRKGNPELLPEFTNNFELSYQKSIDQSFISVEGYYRSTYNKTSRVQSIDSTGIILMTFENLDKDISTGIELMMNLRLVKWMDINLSGNYYYYQLLGSTTTLGDVNTTSNNYDFRGNLNFAAAKNTRFQINGFYSGPSVTAQGKSASNFVVSASLRQDFFQKKLSISLNARDIFNTGRHEFITYGDNFTNLNSFSPTSTTITLSATYKINNYKEKKVKNGMENGEGGDGIM